MRPNAIHRPATPVVRRGRRSALVCVVFVIAVVITGAVSAGPRRAAVGPRHAAHGPHVDISVDFSPDGGHFLDPNQTATVTICSDGPAPIGSTSATFNNQWVAFNDGLRAQCPDGDYGDAGTVSMTLVTGDNTLSVNACDYNDNCGWGEDDYYYTFPTYAMTLVANQQADTFQSGLTGSPSFTIHGTGTAPARVSWRASCSGGVLRCGPTGPDTGSFTLDSGATVSMPVTLYDTVQGTGHVTFTAWFHDSSATRDSVTTPVTVWAPYPTVNGPLSPQTVTPGVTVTDTFTVAVTKNGAGAYTLSKTCDSRLTNCTLTPTGDTISAHGSQRAVLTFQAPYTMANQSGTVSVAAVGVTAGSQSGSGSTQINVGPVPIANVAVTLDQSTLTLLIRDSTQAHATVTYADNSTLQNAPATWSFTAGGVATVNSNGFVTAQGLGTTSIQATVGGFSGSATLVVSSSTGIAATMQGINPQGSIVREQCLTIAAGDDAAYECGDLRLVHPLPGVSTMNRERAPTLIYNSRHSKPTALIAVDVLATNITPSPLQASLTIGGHTLTHNYTWNSACSNVVCRLVIPVVADSLSLATGWYADSLQVTAGSFSASVLGGVAIVNRTTSRFGAGWWLDGLEQLVFTGDTTKVLWVTGDGSTRLYHATGAPDSVFTAQDVVDRPDTLIKSRLDTTWRRHLGNNAIVQFNGGGQHVRTINRQGDTTRFVYDATKAVLDSIILPTPSTTRPAYTFSYNTDTVLAAVHSPGASGTRTDSVAHSGKWRITQITDPDNTTVGFTWDTTNKRIVARRNRLYDTTTYTYDAGGALSQVSVGMARGGEAALVSSFCAAETRTLAACAADSTSTLPLPHTQVVTRLDGPRTDSADVTRFFINRFGAPDTVIDAHGGRTRVQRDATFPALADAVIDPTGFEQDAVYNTRGLLQSSTAKNPVGTGLDAITRYSYDPKWDMVDTITAPTGEVSYFSYDATTGNRLWQQTGPSNATKVTFIYNVRNQLDSIRAPAHNQAQGVAYDSTLGNVSRTTTPLGYHTDITRDAIGEQVTVSTPTDAAQTPSLRTIQQLTYDVMGRLLVDSTTGAGFAYSVSGDTSGNVPSQARVVHDTLDAEGTLLSRTRYSWSAGGGRVGTQSTTFRYDAAHRRRSRVEFEVTTDSTAYDGAGNPVWQRTGSDTVTQKYDALNRLVQRIVSGDSVAEELCGSCDNGTDSLNGPMKFPYYPTVLPGGTTSPDVIVQPNIETFVYDAASHQRAALNGAAHVWRSYYADGALAVETDTVHRYAPDDTSFSNPANLYAYALGYGYDLSGRRLARTDAGGTQTYQYNAVGLLDTTTDVGVVHAFTYDAAGRLIHRATGTHVADTLFYDDDDRRVGRVTNAYTDALTYDARGKVTGLTIQAATVSAMPYVSEQSTMRYDGFGALVMSNRDLGYPNTYNPTMDEYVVDALGNVGRHEVNRGQNFGRSAATQTYEGPHLFETVPDSLSALRDPSNVLQPLIKTLATTDYVYDGMGNQTQANTTVLCYNGCPGGGGGPAQARGRYQSDTAGGPSGEASGTAPRARMVSRDQSYNDVYTTAPSGQSWVRNAYDGAQRLRVSQRYSYFVAPNGAITRRYSFAEYAYDALGRRVSVRTRRDSTCSNNVNPGYDCLQTMDYFVWDGANLLAESRGDGGWGENAVDTTTPPDSCCAQARVRYGSRTAGASESAGSRTQAMTISRDQSGMPWGDFFGQVRYTHAPGAMGLDAPLLVQRENGTTFVPQASWHGTYEDGTNLDGSDMATFTWPARQQGVYFAPDMRVQPVYANAWYGSLLEGQVDANGMVYDRNRYYDPAAGRFTQEDPIGLAGGLNSYGFVGGDPVNSSDPFGLSPDTLEVQGEDLQRAVDEERKRSPAADSAFRELEQSTKTFLLFESNDVNCPDDCPLVGFSWGGNGAGDLPIPPSVQAMRPGLAGASHINVRRAVREKLNPGDVAWHEAVHLTGIVEQGKKYIHCSVAFRGVPNGCPSPY